MVFDTDAFMAYMRAQFTPMDNHFTYDLVRNVVGLGVERHPGDPEGLAGFLAGIVPELRAEETERFWNR